MTITERLMGGVPLSWLTADEWISPHQISFISDTQGTIFGLKLKAIVNDINEVEEAHRGLYIEEEKDENGVKKKTGRWRLQVEGAETEEDIASLRSALAKERQKGERLDALEKKFKDINPEEYRRLQEEAERQRAREEQIQRDTQAAIEAAKRDHEQAMTQVQSQLRDVTVRYHELFVETQLYPHIAEAKGSHDLLLPHLKKRVRVREDARTKELKLELLNADGGKLLGAEGADGTFKDLVEEFRKSERFGRAFDGYNQSGSGAGGDQGGGRGNGQDVKNPWSKEHWNMTEQGKILTAEPERAKALALQAGHKAPTGARRPV
jgi:hypothetical protein